jgi:imidazolonepropionase-like amidohydrolase
MVRSVDGVGYRRRVKNAQEARQAVADLKRRLDFIKVHDHTPRDVFFAIAEEAPRLGLPFAGHVPFAVKVEEAADAGIRSIEHLSNYDVFGECLVNDEYTTAGCRRLFEKLAAKGVWETPTRRSFESFPT